MDNLKAIFSNNLRQWLKRRGMTNVALADKLGVSAQAVTNYVQGINLPKMNRVDDICRILNVTRSDLLSEARDESEIIYQDDDYTLTSGTRRMKDGAADFLHGTLDTMTEPRDDDDTSSTSSIPSRDEIFDWLNTYWLMAADDGTNIERYTDEELLDYYYAAREAYEEEMEKDR